MSYITNARITLGVRLDPMSANAFRALSSNDRKITRDEHYAEVITWLSGPKFSAAAYDIADCRIEVDNNYLLSYATAGAPTPGDPRLLELLNAAITKLNTGLNLDARNASLALDNAATGGAQFDGPKSPACHRTMKEDYDIKVTRGGSPATTKIQSATTGLWGIYFLCVEWEIPPAGTFNTPDIP